MKLVYLASPFTHQDLHVEQERYELITQAGAYLTEKYKYAFFLPITQSYQMKLKNSKLGTVFDFWKKIDLYVISKCDEVWVVMLDGWEQSIGVQEEIKHAKKLNIPIKLFDPLIKKFKTRKKISYV